MKLTKEFIKKVIKEELEEASKMPDWSSHTDSPFDPRNYVESDSPYDQVLEKNPHLEALINKALENVSENVKNSFNKQVKSAKNEEEVLSAIENYLFFQAND